MVENKKEYSQEISELMREIQNSVYVPNKRVVSMLKKLEKLTEEAQDNDLAGFIHYNFARVYSFREDHKKLIKSIKKALYHLLRSNEKELLARTYNLFAVEAIKNGCMDIAYEYSAIAKSVLDEEQPTVAQAVIEVNIGGVFSHLEELKKALDITNKSYKTIQKCKDDEHYLYNLIMILLNLAMLNLDLGEPEKARPYMQKIEQLDESREMDPWCLLPRCRLAVADGDRQLIQELVSAAIRDIIGSNMLGEAARALKNLCRDLLECQEYGFIEQIVEALDGNRERVFPYEASLLNQIKIEYYSAVHNEEKLLESYEEKNAIGVMQEKTEQLISYESIELLQLLEDLRLEKQQAEAGNRLLQQQAETDPLTGLPNRYALTRVFEEAFSEALEQGKMLGVGIADIDGFKEYNDALGHSQGDRCLIEVAKALGKIASKYGLFLARYGGDEFILIYKDMDEKAIKSIEKELARCGEVSLTHGFYCAVPHVDSRIWDFFNMADKNLYDIRKKRS